MHSTHTHITRTSPLDQPPDRFLDEPFFGETLTLLRSVRDHDFGIVDVDPAGAARPIRVPAELSPESTP